MFPKENIKNTFYLFKHLFKQEIGLSSALLKKIVLNKGYRDKIDLCQ